GIDNYWLNHLNINKEYDELTKKINLIFVGELNRNKNVQTTLKVMRKLIDKGYNPHLDIVGTGDSEEKLKNLVRELNISKSIKFHVYISEKEILINLYRKASIFIMPSLKETFGLVYIEAMTQGLPIIYSRNQGIDGYFENGEVGFAVSPENPDNILSKIEEIIKNYQTISKNAINKSKEFNWKNIAEKYIGIYEKIVR